MRKVIPWISALIVIPLVACSFGTGNPPAGPAITPTKSGDQMQTEISQLLTTMPTSTGQPLGEVTPSPDLPTVAVVQTELPADVNTVEAVIQPTQGIIVTETPQPPEAGMVSTATLAPTAAAATAAPTAAATTSTGPTATTSPGDPRKWLGSPASTDPMDNADTWIWPTGSDLYSRAAFINGRQSVQALTTKDGWRMANPKGQDFANLYLEATFNVGETCRTDVPGMSDHYGIIVRVPNLPQPYQGYLYGFNCNGQYSLRSWNWDGTEARRQEMRMLIDWSTPKAVDSKTPINAGTRTTNKMGIMTIGSRIRLYSNGYFLGEYDTSTNANIPHIPSGFFGVFVGSRTDNRFTIWVDEMSYWENPQP